MTAIADPREGSPAAAGTDDAPTTPMPVLTAPQEHHRRSPRQRSRPRRVLRALPAAAGACLLLGVILALLAGPGTRTSPTATTTSAGPPTPAAWAAPGAPPRPSATPASAPPPVPEPAAPATAPLVVPPPINPADPVDPYAQPTALARQGCQSFTSGVAPVLESAVSSDDLAPARRVRMGLPPDPATPGGVSLSAPYVVAHAAFGDAGVHDPRYQPVDIALNALSDTIEHVNPDGDLAPITIGTDLVTTRCQQLPS